MSLGWTLVSSLVACWAIVMAVVIILERRSAAATIAWLLVLAARRVHRRHEHHRAHSAEFGERYWRDTHLRVDGSVVSSLQRIFMEDWYFAAEKLPGFSRRYFPPPSHRGHHVVQVVSSGPDSTSFAIHKLFFAAITEARQRVWATTPYFVPDDPILIAMSTSRASSTPGRS